MKVGFSSSSTRGVGLAVVEIASPTIFDHETEMAEPFTLRAFLSDTDELLLQPTHVEALLVALTAAERPRSFRVLFWLLVQTLQSRAELQAAIMEEWFPSEADLAQLLEDVGGSGTPAVLAMAGIKGQVERLWELSDDAGIAAHMKVGDPWEVVALAPMAALYAERQLDALVDAVARGRQWQNPAEILDPEGDIEVDLEALIGLAQARMVAQGGGGEALNLVTLRLLNHADRVN